MAPKRNKTGYPQAAAVQKRFSRALMAQQSIPKRRLPSENPKTS